MDLQPRTRAFVNDLRSAGGDIATWDDCNVTMPRLMDEFVASIEAWSVGPCDDDEQAGGEGWEANFDFYPITAKEALHLGWLVDALLRDVTGREAKKVDKRLRLQVFGEPPADRSLEPTGYELAIYDGDDQESSIAVVQAMHFAELARFVDALSTTECSLGGAIRRAGNRLDKIPAVGFRAQGYRFDLSLIDVAPDRGR